MELVAGIKFEEPKRGQATPPLARTIGRNLVEVTSKNDVRVQIRPEREAGLRQFLMQRDPEMLDRMRLTPNAALGMSDIVIRWHQGEAIRDAMKIWEHIISILAPHGLWPITAAETICQENLSHVE